MKKAAFLLSFFFVGLFAQAQKVYFIYIQSDSGTPFFLKMNEKLQSSTASGYIILSNLKDSTYNFSIGFPGKQQENKFSVTINKEDRGFLLRTADNQPALFDLQTLAVYKATAGIQETEYNVAELMAQADAFTKLLSLATDDPSILVSGPSQPKPPLLAATDPQTKQTNDAGAEKTISDTTVVAKDVTEVKTIPAADSATVKTETAELKAEEKKNDVDVAVLTRPEDSVRVEKPVDVTETQLTISTEKAEQPYVRSTVTRRSESSTTEGFGLVFLDNQGAQTDTIRILIPNPKMVARLQQPVKQDQTEVPGEKAEPVKEQQAETVVVSNCLEQATDKDFLKLRKSMAAEESDGDMIKEAVKYFNKKCFSTEQIKNLSTLFLTPAGKYDFFQAAYAYTSDKNLFASLQGELKDEYYAGRFKDLVGGH